tara:strand:+ start:564 stop:995 length:432 start_codon:yes stop_codon:yes gene_type:complete
MKKSLRLSSLASKVKYPGIVIDSFEIKSIQIADLFCPCKVVPGFVEDLVESFKRDGLLNPVIVVRLSVEDFLEGRAEKLKKYYRQRIPKKQQTINVVWGGNNRVEAARILGFKAIDCVMMPNFDIAMKVQDNHRNEWSLEEDV